MPVRRDVLVVPDVARRGTLVVPDELRWIVQHYATDATSASLRKMNRRGMLVMPDAVKWMIQRYLADLTSRSLRKADAISASLRPEKRVPPTIEGVPVTPAETHTDTAAGSVAAFNAC